MLLLSIDVGITNMAFCILDGTSIVDWKVIDLQSHEKHSCSKCKNKASVCDEGTYFCKRHAPTANGEVLPDRRHSQSISLIEIGKCINRYFDEYFLKYTFTNVAIENQIGPIATRMKTIQGMIAQYFIIKQPGAIIEFVSSSNKLKGIGKKLSYAERKKLGIEHCIKFLNETQQNAEITAMFLSSKKKDDLADSLLQGLYQNGIKK
jgi:hypothetical protein